MGHMHSSISIYYTHGFNSVGLHEIEVKKLPGEEGADGSGGKKGSAAKNGGNVC